MEFQRSGTWYWSIQQLLEQFNIRLDPKETKKSRWKKEVKKKITEGCECKIRVVCENSTKGRTAATEKYELKPYLVQLPIHQAKHVLRMRLHMVDIPCNYGERDSCWLCGVVETIRTEHYLECSGTEHLRVCLGVGKKLFSSMNTVELVNVSRFYQLVEQRNVLNQKLRCWKKKK